MDITHLGTVVEYRQKAMQKDRFACNAVILKIHGHKMIDLYTLKKGQSCNVHVDLINEKAYVMGILDDTKHKYNVHYSKEPIAGTWGYKE